MHFAVQLEPVEDELFLAGEKVEPGSYRHIESGREVRLTQTDYLPASLDGRVACYVRVRPGWERPSFTEGREL